MSAFINSRQRVAIPTGDSAGSNWHATAVRAPGDTMRRRLPASVESELDSGRASNGSDLGGGMSGGDAGGGE